MSAVTLLDYAALAAVCQRHGVSRLRVFGSAVSDRFDPLHSDIDFLVDFAPDTPRTFQALFALQADLEQVVGRPVDLVEERNMRNPYVASSILSSAQDVYAA